MKKRKMAFQLQKLVRSGVSDSSNAEAVVRGITPPLHSYFGPMNESAINQYWNSWMDIIVNEEFH